MKLHWTDRIIPVYYETKLGDKLRGCIRRGQRPDTVSLDRNDIRTLIMMLNSCDPEDVKKARSWLERLYVVLRGVDNETSLGRISNKEA